MMVVLLSGWFVCCLGVYVPTFLSIINYTKSTANNIIINVEAPILNTPTISASKEEE